MIDSSEGDELLIYAFDLTFDGPPLCIGRASSHQSVKHCNKLIEMSFKGFEIHGSDSI